MSYIVPAIELVTVLAGLVEKYAVAVQAHRDAMTEQERADSLRSMDEAMNALQSQHEKVREATTQ